MPKEIEPRDRPSATGARPWWNPAHHRDRRPVLLARITDTTVPDADKQVALFTCTHCASELNGPTGVLRLMKWLLSDDPAAAEIRRRQVVLCVPYPNPDGVARDGGSDVYTCWDFEGVVAPDKHPEAVALKGIFDEFQPDLHADIHGFNFAEQKMWESTGISWASGISRSYLPDVPRLMDEAAEAAGFLITKGEQSAGQIRTTCDIPGASHHYYIRAARPNVTSYPYHKFHTIAMILESGFEESTAVRLRRALQIGHERWRGERYAGYPANQVGCWTSMAIAAWGTTAAERRRSRVELWQKLPQLAYGCAHPEPRGSITAYCATTPAAAQRYLANRRLDRLLEAVRAEPRFDADAIVAMADRIPATNLACRRDGTVPEGKVQPVRHGMVIRLLVPYNDAEVTNIRLDGHPLAESPSDGYTLRRDPGTIVEIAIPPAKVRDFHIAWCFYTSPTKRRPGFRPEDWD